MLRTTLLLTLTGCLPPPAMLAPLRPSELSLRCDGELTGREDAARGVPTARSGWAEQRHWQTLLLLSWHPSTAATANATEFATSAEGPVLDPSAFADPTGSGSPWLVPTVGLPVQP